MTASQTTDTAVQLPAKYGISPGVLRPVTIRQLLDATREHSEAPFQIDDIEARVISLVAHVVSVRKSLSGSSITYELEDGTSRGRISARQWSSEANCDGDDYSGLYVHIVGHLDRKVQLDDRNWVIIEHIDGVTDTPNRLFFHILETAFVTLSLQRGPPPVTTVPNNDEPHNATAPAPTPARPDVPTASRRVAGSSSQSQPAVPARVRNSGPPTSSSSPRQRAPHTPAQKAMSATPIRQPVPTRRHVPAMSPSPSPAPSSPSPGPSSPPPSRTPSPPQRPSKTSGKRRQPGIKRDPYADLTVLQRAILLQLLNAPPSEQGTHVSIITTGVSHHDVTPGQIGAALDGLVEQGHIESTIDDSHYAIKTSHYPRSP